MALVLLGAIPTGWVSNIYQQPNIFVDFQLQRRLALNTKVYADERINAEMKSLSILCVRR